VVALARAFGWTYRDIMETPHHILLGCLTVLAEERQKAERFDTPEWEEWEKHGKEWVAAQWPRTGSESS
jgi:hypothetical protein